MLQLREDRLKRLLIIGEEQKNERMEYYLNGTFCGIVIDEPEKKETKQLTMEEFEKMLNAI